MVEFTMRGASPIGAARERTIQDTTRVFIEQEKQQSAARSAQMLREARKGGPQSLDISARANRLRDTTANASVMPIDKMPPLTNPEVIGALEDQVAAKREQDLLFSSPKTTSFFNQPNNALAAHDSVEEVSVMEGLWNAIPRTADTVVDWARTNPVIDNNMEGLDAIRRSTMTLAEIEDEIREQRAGELQPTRRDGSTGPANESSFARELSLDAQSMFSYLSSRILTKGSEMFEGADSEQLVDMLDVSTEDRLAEIAEEDAKRAIDFPISDARRRVEARVAEMPADDAWGGLSNWGTLIIEDPFGVMAMAAEVGAESGLQIGIGALSTIVTKNPALATTMLAGTSGATSYARSDAGKFSETIQSYGYDITTPEGRQKLMSDPKVLTDIRDASKRYAMVVALMDGASAGVASQTLLKNPLGEMVIQAVAQSTLGAFSELFGMIAAGEEISWNEVIAEALFEFTTAPVDIAILSGSGVRAKIRKANEAKQQKKQWDILNGKIDSSELKARDRATFKQAIKHVTENGPAETIHIDAEVMNQLFDEGDMTIEEFFDAVPELDYLEYQHALATGGLYRIPSEIYADKIAGSAIADKFGPNVKFNPDDMTLNEATTFEADVKAMQEGMAENSDKIDTIIGKLDGPLQDELSRLTTEIQSSSNVTPDTANRQAAILVGNARTMASRAGITTSEYLRRYTLPRVQDGSMAAAAAPKAKLAIDELQATLNSGGEIPLSNFAHTMIAQELDRLGVEPENASRDDILAAAVDLQARGVTSFNFDEADFAVTGVEEPDGDSYMQTATLRGGQEDLSEWGIDPTKRNKTRDMALALQKRQRALYGKINKKQRGPKTVAKMAQWMADEVEFELQTPEKSAVGWYGPKFQAALDIMGEKWAPLVNEAAAKASNVKGVKTVADARALTTALFAVSSNGTKVVENVDNAMNIILELEETGTIGKKKHQRAVALNAHIERILAMAAEMGAADMQAMLTEEMEFREANKLGKAEGIKPKSGYPAAMIVPRASAYFGPKLSAFYANLTGSEGYLTMDLWWSRTINRYRGDVLPRVIGLKNGVDTKGNPIGLHRFKHLMGRPDLTDNQALNYVTEYAEVYAKKGWKNGTAAEKAANTIYKAAFKELDEAPTGPSDRAFMIEVATAAVAEVNQRTGVEYSIADIQALMWYYEKRLLAEMGVRDSGDLSYEEAARKIVDRDRRVEAIGEKDEEFFQMEEDGEDRSPTAPARIEDFDPKNLRDMSEEDMLELFKRPNWFVVTGTQSALGEFSTEENQASNAALRQELDEAGLEYIEVEGMYDGTSDGISLLVIGDNDAGFALGAEYNQESILTNEGIVYTDGSGQANVPFSGLTYGFAAKRLPFYSKFVKGLPIDAFSLDLDFPKPADVTVDDGDGTSHYGVRVEPKGIRLTHWSREPLDVIDPNMAGTGELIGAERNTRGPKKSFFGLHIGRAGGYKRESSKLGMYRHEVFVDPKSMYPWWADPDGLKAKIPANTPVAQERGAYEELIKAAGYKGYFVTAGNLGDTAVLFEAAAPDNVVEDNDAQSKRTSEFNAWFGDSRVVNADGSPKMMYHGTRVDWITEFLGSSHFGTAAAARQRLNPDEKFDREQLTSGRRQNESIYPVYLNMKNPIILGREGMVASGGKIYEGAWANEGEMMQQVGYHLLSMARQSNRPELVSLGEEIIQSLERPLAVDDNFTENTYIDEEQAVWGQLENVLGEMGPAIASQTYPVAYESMQLARKEAMDKLRDAGFDGVEYINSVEDRGSTSYIIFDPTQVKSAYNAGNWDVNKKHILHQKKDKGPNGSIILPKDMSQDAVIKLFETANLSTMLHESGHYFLWNLQRLATDGIEFAQEELGVISEWFSSNAEAIATEAGVDMAQVEEYLELGTTGQGDVDKAIHTAMHEQFARGFEAYLMEGKSPSNAMRSAFENITAWLLQWYKHVRKLNVNINDDIRGVFDRMLATDEEMMSAEGAQEVNDMVAETARAMGLDEDTYRKLTELSQQAREEGRMLARKDIMLAEQKMRSAEYQDRYNEIEAEERERVNALPVNRAIQWLGYGRWLGDDAPDLLPEDLRFDTTMLVAEYEDTFGENFIDKLPRGRRPMFAKDTMWQADDVAEFFGYDSGARLIEDMIAAPKANDAIKSATEARAREELKDIMGNPEEMAETALEALHGEKRGQVIVAEMRAMNRIGGKGKVTTRALAKAAARELISKMKVRDAINPNRFLAAERKHAEDAARSLAAGDIEAAFESKRKQLIQHEMYIASKKAAEEVGKAERLAKRLKSKGTRENLAGEYLGAIDEVLETYDFRKVSGKADDRRGRLAAYIKMMETANRMNEVSIPDHVLKNSQKIGYKQLEVRQLRGVYDTLKNIEHTARLKEKLRLAQKERDLQEVRDIISAEFAENIEGKPLARVERDGDKRKKGLRGYFNLVRGADTILSRISGYKDNNPMVEIFKGDVDRAGNMAQRMRQEATVDLEALFAPYDQTERNKMAVPRTWTGYTKQSLSKWEVISIALNMGNATNYQRLTSPDSKYSLTKAEVKALTDQLDKRDWDFVQGIWDYLDGKYWPLIKEREERVSGVAPEKVEAKPVTTQFGEYRGGYYPIVYDPRLSSAAADDKQPDLMADVMGGRFGKAATANGHTEARAAGGGNRTVQLGMQVLTGHINNVIHDLAFGEAVNTTWKLLQDGSIRDLFVENGMAEDHAALEMWIQDVAAGPAQGNHVLAGLTRRLKTNFSAMKLMWNMSTVLVQVTGAAQSMAQIGSVDMARGYTQYISHGGGFSALAKSIAERSEFMAERENTFQKDIYDLNNDMMNGPLDGRVKRMMNAFMQAGFAPMQKMQYYAVDAPTWLAAHGKRIRQGADEQTAVEYADRMVRKAQASGVYADRTAFERGTLGRNTRQNEFARIFTALGSYFFAKFNVTEEVIFRAIADVKNPNRSSALALMKLVGDLALLFVVEGIAYRAIRGELPDDEDTDDLGPLTWPLFLAKEGGLAVLAVFPFVRDVSSAFQGFGGGGAYGGINETVARGAISAKDFVTGEATASDLRAILDAIGLATGLPSTAAWRILEGMGISGEEFSVPAMIVGR